MNDQGLSVEAVTQYVCLRCGRDMKTGGHCCECSRGVCPECRSRRLALAKPPPTHERNVLMWVATRGWLRVLMWFLFWVFMGYLFFSIVGCGNGSPLSSTEIGHPNEEMIVAWSECYYAYFGLEEKLHGSLTVAFTDERRVVPCPSHMQNPPEECIAAGWAAPGTRLIHYYRPWVRSNDRNAWDLQYTAAHEVCHLSGIFIDEQIPDRPEQLTAPQCAALVTQHSRVTGECNDGSQG